MQDLTKSLDIKSIRFGMEVSAEKRKTRVVGKTSEALTIPVR